MNFIKYLFPLLILLTLTGCTSMKYNYNIKDKETLLVFNKPTNIAFGYAPLLGKFIKVGTDEKADYFLPYSDGARMDSDVIFGEPGVGIQVIKKNKEVCIISNLGITDCKKVEYKIIEQTKN